MPRVSQYSNWGQISGAGSHKPSTQPVPPPVESTTIPLKHSNHLKFALKNTQIVVVKVEADWCEPCKVLHPKYEELARKTHGTNKFTFFTDDIDRENSYHASKVTAVPTFFVYTDGDMNPKKQFTGDFDQLEDLVLRIMERIRNESSSAPPNTSNNVSTSSQSTSDDTAATATAATTATTATTDTAAIVTNGDETI